MKILIVDDDFVLLQQLQSALKGENYMAAAARNGSEALAMLHESSFDLVILDIMMPELDGLSFLREIRAEKWEIPVLLLSAKGDIEDKIHGLDLGADDYLSKPFSVNELFARIRALLRRKSRPGDSILRIGNLTLDTVSRQVCVDGFEVDLTPKEFAILEFLAYNRNRVVSKLSLTEHVWHDNFDPFAMSNVIDVHIKNLRRKIGDGGRGGMLRTVRGVGYLLRNGES
jgi:DNA-binding response OmpR family regulator